MSPVAIRSSALMAPFWVNFPPCFRPPILPLLPPTLMVSLGPLCPAAPLANPPRSGPVVSACVSNPLTSVVFLRWFPSLRVQHLVRKTPLHSPTSSCVFLFGGSFPPLAPSLSISQVSHPPSHPPFSSGLGLSHALVTPHLRSLAPVAHVMTAGAIQPAFGPTVSLSSISLLPLPPSFVRPSHLMPRPPKLTAAACAQVVPSRASAGSTRTSPHSQIIQLRRCTVIPPSVLFPPFPIPRYVAVKSVG